MKAAKAKWNLGGIEPEVAAWIDARESRCYWKFESQAVESLFIKELNKTHFSLSVTYSKIIIANST